MSYKIILTGGQGEIEVKKSRFIAAAHPVSSEREAQEFLTSARKKYFDARHNCYAYTLGSRFELQRSSDDGEPGGTAGRPILELLLKEDLHNCIVVVTRYFGGTLLGTGGLIRAYQAAAGEALAHSTTALRIPGRKYTVRTDYNSIGRLQSLAAGEDIPVTDTRYTDAVDMDVIVPEEREDAFCLAVADATGARAQTTPGDYVEYARAGKELIVFEDSKGGAEDVRL